MIDVMIIAHNEALNLPHCLATLQGWTRQVFVIDSGSTDETREIARRYGARVVEHEWVGYARQKNWGLQNLPLESDWVLILDADEVITEPLRARLVTVASRPADQVPENGFFINRLTYFLGKPIRYCGYFPSYNLRFFKRGKGIYEDREVHEHIVIASPLGYISEPMIHDDRRGLEHFVAKHNRYSTLEARAIFNDMTRPVPATDEPNLSGQTRRRRWLKRHLIPYMPATAMWRFLYMYVFRLGFLDGRAGLDFCKFISIYDYMVALKLRALLQRSLTEATAPFAAQTSGLAIAEGQDPVIRAAPPLERPASPVRPPAEPPPQVHEQPEPAPRHPQADILAAMVMPDRLPPGSWPAVGSVPVSVLIPVKNEGRNIIECIRHVLWADEIVVIDSQSTDQTVPLSQSMGASVYQFHYSTEGWPKKKNWALNNVRWRNEWVLILDADEIMTPELTDEVFRVTTGQPLPGIQQGCGDGYWLNRRFMFMGRWIKGCGYYPSYNIRLFKHRLGRYERIGNLGDTSSGDNEVHEHIVLKTGPAGYLKGEFLHYAYPDLATWIDKHNRYSNWEAFAMGAENLGLLQASIFGGPIERRRWLKRVTRRLPFRPTLRFLYSYILKRGILDGYPGYVMSRLMGWYEFISIAKYQEMDSHGTGAENPDAAGRKGARPDASRRV